jgi:ribosomal-protein-alanine N-acetyltransferase
VSMWEYPEPYSVYDGNANDPDIVGYLIDPANRIYAAVDDTADIIGFFSFGRDAQVPGVLEPADAVDPDILDVGLGLRPDLTGRGMGLQFFLAGLDFARRTFAPARFRLAVMKWNKRAIKVYERAGFRRVRQVTGRTASGRREFVLMEREA